MKETRNGGGPRTTMKKKAFFKQGFQAAHRKAFGRSTGIGGTGLRLAIIMELETSEMETEEIFVIEHSPSQVYRERLNSGCAAFVALDGLEDPGEKVRRDIRKLLEEGYGMDLTGDDSSGNSSKPGWLALAACSFYE